MKYKIVYDKPGKLRVRFGQYVFTKKQGYGLEETLAKIAGVVSVEANSANGGILIRYKGGIRSSLLDALGSLKRKELPEKEPTEPVRMKEANREFLFRIAKMAIWHYGKRIFLPMDIRRILSYGKAVKFFYKGLDALLSGKLNVDVLDASSIACAFLQGSSQTASSIMFMLGITDALEEHTRKQTVSALENSLSLQVENVWLVTDSGDVKIPVRDIQIGDHLRVQSGSMVPVDGTVISGEAMVNESSLTGESAAVRRTKGHTVYAGTALEEGSVVISVMKTAGESRVHDIAKMIDESEALKAGVQSKAEALADSIVPFSFLAFATTFLFTGNFTKAAAALMVDYSCALKLSIPISVVSAMKEAADHRILIKGGKYLEAFEAADTIIFDKTGTLTSASPQVAKVIPLNGYERSEVLKDAACLEEHFPHSVARAIVNQALKEELVHKEEHATVEYVVAHGISTSLRGKNAKIGSSHYIFEDEKIPYTDEIRRVENSEMEGLSVIYMAVDGSVVGMIGIEDPVRNDAKAVLKELRRQGFEHIIMMTGDGEGAAKRAADALGITEYYSQVLPEDKAEMVNKLKKAGHKVVMVGDGINDSPALASADVSIAMRDSSDLARQVADITLLSEDLTDLVVLRTLSRKLMVRTQNNYRFIIGFNTGLMAAGIFGLMTSQTTSILHNLSTMLLSGISTRPFLNDSGLSEKSIVQGNAVPLPD
ncbi:MAG: heavy metal translocating P-type ATPase [Lachnospiraceae bacterium]|nr:heavy metal translocating P-type ATPase [Lachnospiraceae bacterium]